MALFADRSFDEVRIEEICDAAGIAKATFFLHFAGKAALIEEFNARLVARLADDMAAAPAGAEVRLRMFVTALITEWANNAGVMRQMAREFLNQPSLLPAAQAANREIVDVVETIIADGQATGEFSATTDPSLAATALVSTWGAFTARWSGPPDQDLSQPDITKLHNDLLTLILGGLTPRTS